MKSPWRDTFSCNAPSSSYILMHFDPIGQSPIDDFKFWKDEFFIFNIRLDGFAHKCKLFTFTQFYMA